MKLLITLEELGKLKSREDVPCQCYNCNKTFYIAKNLAQRGIKGTKEFKFCSRECHFLFKKEKSIELECKNCHKIFKRFERIHRRMLKDGFKNTFCSKDCSLFHNNSLRRKSIKIKQCEDCKKKIYKNNKKCHQCKWKQNKNDYILRWRQGLEKGYSGREDLPTISTYIRQYLFEKYNRKCVKCGWGTINEFTKRVPLQINHIDGNARNNKEENLELICPNCHSLTATFGSRNKNSVRKRRRIYNQ